MDEWKCRDLITLNISHAYCGGLEPTSEARHLNAYYRRRKLPILTLFSLFVGLSKAVACPNTPNLPFFLVEMEVARLRA